MYFGDRLINGVIVKIIQSFQTEGGEGGGRYIYIRGGKTLHEGPLCIIIAMGLRLPVKLLFQGEGSQRYSEPLFLCH